MKPLILFSLSLICHLCTAQKKDDGTIQITYNMHKGAFEKDFPLLIKEGTTIALSYTAINPFAFKSNVTFSDINHSFQDGMDIVQSALNGISGPEKKAADDAESEALEATSSGKSISSAGDYLRKKYRTLSSMQQHFGRIQQSILAINAIITIDTLIKIAKNDPANYSGEVMEAGILKPVAAYGITKDNIPEKFQSHQQQIYRGLDSISFTLMGLKTLNDKTIQPLIDSLEKKVAALNNLYTGSNANVLLKNISIIQYNLHKVLTADYNLPPGNISTAKGDFIVISDELKDNTGKVAFTIAPHPIRTYGGTRVDFSVGLAANIGGNGTEYSLRKNPTDAKTGEDTAHVMLYKSNKNKLIQFNPVVFVHWYKTTSCNLQWMLTTGLAPDFSTLANSRLFIGTSLGFPSSNELSRRLVLSIGASVGYADVLKNKYRDWKNYQRFSDLDDIDLTEKSLRVGGFFAISYNLGGSGHE
ncbi:hypothetical protein [Chitinophaga sp. S165]|uniref:hypothetical protein n=1 Tax=Chitinophaga sp. S165 TaxID=2135462 RepID=UPI000D70C10E|nr:hypothetical protein [Chitinophaga sp. S165]PWV45815.1 hypothetical protein C7475_11232 [Chitinophaga sp. S165]